MKKLLQTLATAISGTEKEFTTGSINRAILMLSVPMILEMVMEALFAVVDIYFVARIGEEAITAVGLTEVVLTLIYATAIGISMAATALVSRRVGEQKLRHAGLAAAQTILLGVGLSIVLGLLGFTFAGDILRLMGSEESVIEIGIGYTRILFGSNIVIMLLFLLNAIFRGAGDASLAMQSLWLANGLNILLDPLFIFGIGPFPEMGVQGAAVATTIGRGTGVLFQLYILFKGRSIIQFSPHHFRIRWGLIKRIVAIAAGGTGQFLIGSASWIFLMRIVSVFGTQVVAGYTIAIRIIIFTILPSMGMANAAATLVGQNLGAQQPERAATSVWRTAFFNMLFLLLVSILFFTLAPQVIGLFSEAPEVVGAGVEALRIICIGYVFFAYGMVISQSFNGAGDTRTPTIINFFCFWMLEIPLAYFLALYLEMGPEGVYWALGIANTLLAIICIIVFRQGHWKKIQV
ncbi:MAG: MATE family efflux transporter [Bacteroidota bacterium]